MQIILTFLFLFFFSFSVQCVPLAFVVIPMNEFTVVTLRDAAVARRAWVKWRLRSYPEGSVHLIIRSPPFSKRLSPPPISISIAPLRSRAIVHVDLSSYRMPNLGAYTFAGCIFLRSVVLPSSLSAVDDFMFMECFALRSLVLPAGIREIGSRSFFGCRSLSDLSLPRYVTSVGQRAFAYCLSLETVTVAQGDTNTFSDGDDDDDGGLSGLVLPSGLKVLGDFAFVRCCSLSKVSLPPDCQLCDACFYGCSSLRMLTLPSNLTCLPSQAFYDCSVLKYLKLPDRLEKVGQSCFAYCTALRSVTFPASVSSIGKGAFQFDSFLSEVALASPSSVTIHPHSFENCSNLILKAKSYGIGVVAFLICKSEREIRRKVVLVASLRFNDIVNRTEGTEEDKVATAKAAFRSSEGEIAVGEFLLCLMKGGGVKTGVLGVKDSLSAQTDFRKK